MQRRKMKPKLRVSVGTVLKHRLLICCETIRKQPCFSVIQTVTQLNDRTHTMTDFQGVWKSNIMSKVMFYFGSNK